MPGKSVSPIILPSGVIASIVNKVIPIMVTKTTGNEGLL